MKSSKKKTNDYELDPLAGDLSSLFDEGDWKKLRFELTCPKNKTITLRISEELLKSIKDKAKKLKIDYHKLIRIVLEKAI